MGTGWIKLHRRAFDNPYLRKPNYFYVFMFLCSEANHDNEFDKEYIFEGKRIKLDRGQCIISQKQIAIDSKIPLGSLNNILKVLKAETMIETRSDRRSTLVTIKNYDVYQDVETTIETKLKPYGNQTETHKNLRTKELKKKDTNVSKNKFVKPTLEQVKEYFAEQKTTIDPEKFYYHYESTNWHRGKAKIKNWKACLKTWKENEKKGDDQTIKQPDWKRCSFCKSTDGYLTTNGKQVRCPHGDTKTELREKLGL